MTIKVYKICLFDGKRIHELYEECARKEGKIREAEKERNDHRRQIRQYGRDFKDLLEQIKELKADRDQLKKEQVLLKEMYVQSEKARKSLGEKLEHALGALELLKERVTPSVTVSREIGGDTSPEGGGKRAAEGVGPYSNFGPLGPTKGGARA